ncbi:Unknown protein [Striga hermonthica]|uniref:Tf2-1-like SH3-like domain-containing protein n=1 Tax=Striga hermonthica TaxID=68872 RepID=A0A9N7MH96_STRHE|nr:Unknown protein [Striga hermonthica]
MKEKIGEVAYRLELPVESQIHPVMHVSQLKMSLSDDHEAHTRLPTLNGDGQIIVQPRRALKYPRIKRPRRFHWEVLVEWEDLPAEEATWKNMQDIRCILKNAYNRARRAQLKKARLEADVGTSLMSMQQVFKGLPRCEGHRAVPLQTVMPRAPSITTPQRDT